MQKLQSKIERLENEKNFGEAEEEADEEMKENEAPVYVSDKKTDELKGQFLDPGAKLVTQSDSCLTLNDQNRDVC